MLDLPQGTPFATSYDNKMSFLDISITRDENELQMSLFCKKTFIGVYLPNKYKKKVKLIP